MCSARGTILNSPSARRESDTPPPHVDRPVASNAAVIELVYSLALTFGFVSTLAFGGVAFASPNSLFDGCWRNSGRPRIRDTEGAAQTVRSAAIQFRAENPRDGCPSMDDLAEQQYLDSGRRLEDAWENGFRIECVGRDIVVTSAGPDELFGTEDDIE